MSGLEEKVAAGFSKFEDRLAVLESLPVLSAILNSGCFKETDTEISEETAEDLTTINMEAFWALNKGDHAPTASPVCTPALQPTSTAQKVGEEKYLRHPFKNQACPADTGEGKGTALKLLPYFFTKEELATSNTDASHDKQSLNNNKLII